MILFRKNQYKFERGRGYDSELMEKVPYLIIWKPDSERYERSILDIQFELPAEADAFIVRFKDLTEGIDILCDEDLFKYLLDASIVMAPFLKKRLEDRITRLI